MWSLKSHRITRKTLTGWSNVVALCNRFFHFSSLRFWQKALRGRQHVSSCPTSLLRRTFRSPNCYVSKQRSACHWCCDSLSVECSRASKNNRTGCASFTYPPSQTSACEQVYQHMYTLVHQFTVHQYSSIVIYLSGYQYSPTVIYLTRIRHADVFNY